jgi:hypothetical protein
MKSEVAQSYREAIVTHLDILGFTKMVAEAGNNDAKVLQIANVLKQFRKSTKVPEYGGALTVSSRFTSYSFSDLTLRVTQLLDPEELSFGLWFELLNLSSIQALLVAEGIISRGGITHDRVFCDSELVFGPGPTRAYELERDIAVFPRIVIDTPLIEAAFSTKRRHSQYDWPTFIAEDEDKIHFVDYLFAQFWNYWEIDEYEQAVNLVRRHRDVVLKNLGTTDERIKEKYIWMAAYHNTALSKLTRHSDFQAVRKALDALDVPTPSPFHTFWELLVAIRRARALREKPHEPQCR